MRGPLLQVNARTTTSGGRSKWLGIGGDRCTSLTMFMFFMTHVRLTRWLTCSPDRILTRRATTCYCRLLPLPTLPLQTPNSNARNLHNHNTFSFRTKVLLSAALNENSCTSPGPSPPTSRQLEPLAFQYRKHISTKSLQVYNSWSHTIIS